MKKINLIIISLCLMLSLASCYISEYIDNADDPYYPHNGSIVYEGKKYNYCAMNQYFFNVAYPLKYQPIEIYTSENQSYSAPTLDNPPFIVMGRKYGDVAGYVDVYFCEDYNIQELTISISNRQGPLEEKIKISDLFDPDTNAHISQPNPRLDDEIDGLWIDIQDYPMLATWGEIYFINGEYYFAFADWVRKENPLVLYKVSDKLYDMMGEYWDQIVAETV